MSYTIILFIVLFALISYFIYSSYSFQLLIHKIRVKKTFIEEFKKQVKGKTMPIAYFAPSHKIISKLEYKALSNINKMNFSKCYNIIKFKTADTNWELFFNLIKEDENFIEIFNLRSFPSKYRIKSEGNVEKNYSRLNVFTNNSYLTKILEKTVLGYLKWLIRHNGDIILISSNNLHYKATLDSRVLSTNRAMDMVKAINSTKLEIYKKDVIEY